MGAFDGLGILTALIAVPFVGSFAAAAFGKLSGSWARLAALFVALVEVFLASVATYRWLDGGQLPLAEPSAVETADRLALWSLNLDGLALPLVVLTAVLAVVAVLASWKIDKSPGAHHAMLMLLTGATMGVFLAADLILLYVFWEAVLIPMFFLIGKWGHERRRHAAIKFFLYTFLGSALMLVGLLVIIGMTGLTGIGQIAALLAVAPEVSIPAWVFWLVAIGFLVKIPAVPFHTWLPDAHVEAPTAGSIMLAGVLLKMGGYGLLRVALPFMPEAFAEAAPILAALGIVGIVYGAFTAMAQKDLKRLVAYSSVAHMGFVVLAIAVGTQAAIGAAMLTMISHGVVSALLFLLVGLLYERAHTREIDRFGGLMRTIPAWGVTFSFAALASLGLPGLSGFPGEFLTLVEAFEPFGYWLVAALVGLVVSAAYHLWAIRRVNHGPEPGTWAGMKDLDLRERIAIAPLAIGIVALGVWPGLVLHVTDSAAWVISEFLRSVL